MYFSNGLRGRCRQGATEYTGTTKKRFLINSTVGLGDLQDKAPDMGSEARKVEQGQDMAKVGRRRRDSDCLADAGAQQTL